MRVKKNNIYQQAYILLFSICVVSCSQEATDASLQQSAEPDLISVDLILTNGSVITVDENFTIHDTVIVENGLIVQTGDNSLLDVYSSDEIVDLEGKVLMPGFNDSHIHISGSGRRNIDLTKVTSITELKDMIRSKVEQLGTGEWITGYGWAEDNFVENRNPVRKDLDDAAPNNPVILRRAGGHSAVSNSLALQLAFVTLQTPQPDGGFIERDENGELNGIIREEYGMISSLVPPPDYNEVIVGLEVNLNALLAQGITSITDALSRPSNYEMWEELYENHTLALPRAAMQMLWEDPEVLNELRERVGSGSDMLKLGAIKIAADGGFTGPAAFTLEPYVNQGDYRGYLNMPEEEFVSQLNAVHDAGWQVGIHAIGDAAIVLAVDILADILEKSPREDHRHYLNHFTMLPPDSTMEKMSEFDIHITQQPNFLYTLEQRYVDNLDRERLQHNNPLRSPINHGLTVALSSDVLPIGPFVGIYSAVTRKGKSGAVYAPEEAMTIEEAIRGYTLLSAFLNFEENVKGSLEPGKFADMILLSDDILNIDPENIMNIEVEKTWLGGALVYIQ